MIIVHYKIRRGKEIKEKARALRKNGQSYSEIVKELGVPRSTLHLWLRDLAIPIRYTGEARKAWWKEIQKLAIEANRKKYIDIYSKITQKAKSESEEITLNQNIYKSLLSVLYWAEGAKSNHNNLTFANTDPKLILLYITLLRKCYPVDESKFRVRVHLHNYHDEQKVKKFWSDLLNIPLSRFGKTYRKERSKEKTFRQNFGGICFVVYNSVYLKEEIVQFAYSLGQRVTGKVNVPEVSTNWIKD